MARFERHAALPCALEVGVHCVITSTNLTLPHADPSRIVAAVCAVLRSEIDDAAPTTQRLAEGAKLALAHDAEATAARQFQAFLEVGYLVASADGLADAERRALAELLEQATGRVADRATLEQHFRDLDAACAVLGRSERLRRVAAEFDTGGDRHQAIGFGALVAVSDGAIADAELEALLTLGAHCELPKGEVLAVVERCVRAVAAELGGGA